MDELNNINNFLDNSMKSSLLDKTSDDFTAKLMLEIEIAKEFQKEDKNTFRFLNIFIIGIVGAIVSSAVILAVLLGNQVEQDNPATEGFLSSMYGFFNGLSHKVFALVGLKLSDDSIFYLMGIGAVIVLFTLVDKFVLKRNTIN
jgi:uncharacterized membrane protein YeaQ/YmgE (transglycosylase-associated protein family)